MKTLKEKEKILYGGLSIEEILFYLKKECGLMENDTIFEADLMFGGYWLTKLSKDNAKYVYAFLDESYFKSEEDAKKASDRGFANYGNFLRS